MIIDLKVFNFNLKKDFFLLKKILLAVIIFITLIVFICMKYRYPYIGMVSAFAGYSLIQFNKVITKQAYGINFKDSLNFFVNLNKYINKKEIELLKKQLTTYETFEERNNFNIIFIELLSSNSFNNKDIDSRFKEVNEMINIIKNNK